MRRRRQFPAHHLTDDRLGRRCRRIERGDVRTVAVYGDAVGNGEDLGHPVRHVQHRHPLRAELPNELEEPRRLVRGEGR